MLRHLLRSAKVTYVLSLLLARLGFRLLWERLRRTGRESNGPRLVREALERLGGTWVKLGQALALRFDLLPPSYCYELFKLLNQVRTFPYHEARRIIQEDLGKPPEELFQEMEQTSFAAASIGQVYRGVLRCGTKVAVKVQRPGVAGEIRADLQLMYLLAPFADWLRLLGSTRTKDIIDEFAAWTMDELDYRVEARHAENLVINAQDDPFERNARIYPQYCSPRVLTMQLIEGIPLIEIINALRGRNDAFLEDLTADGYELYTIAEHLTWNLLNQLYRFGYFHADLHPANLFVLPGNAIGYVDFGIVGNISVEVRDSLAQYACHLYQGRVDRATEEFMRWVYPSERTSVRDARRDMVGIIDDYLSHLRARAGGGKGVSTFEVDFLNAMRRHHMGLHSDIAIYLKALVTANAVIFELAPNYDLQKTENRFFRRLVREEIASAFEPDRLAMEVYEYGYRLRRALDSLEGLERSGEEAGTFLRDVQASVRRWIFVAVLMGVATWLLLAPGRGQHLVDEYLGERGRHYLPYVSIAVCCISILRIFQQNRQLVGVKRSEAQAARAALRGRWQQPSKTS